MQNVMIISSFNLEPIVANLCPATGAPRNPAWARESQKWLRDQDGCAVCGETIGVEVHHIRPFHLFPELEMDPDNWLALSRPWHLYLGHLGNWSNWNPDVKSDADRFARAITVFRRKHL